MKRVTQSWSATDEERACDLRAAGEPHAVIAELLERSLWSVRHKTARLNAGEHVQFRPWDKVGIRRLRKLYPLAEWAELERAFPGRSRNTIRTKARKLGLSRFRAVDAIKELAKIEALSDTEAAYIAGMIDGEGSIILTNGRLVMSMGSTCHEIILWFHEKIGGRSYFYATGSGLGTKPFWRWHLSKVRAAAALVKKIRPWMIIKRDTPAGLYL